jgi:pimeloyl-ACP methyl ester carboxylesterase
MASRYFSFGPHDVHYVRRGMGDPLLLVHNLYPGASGDEFEYNIAELARHFTVYAIDLLGFGLSDAPWMRYTAGTYVNLLRKFIEEEIGGRAHVMAAGLSCGYAAEVAVWRPDLINRLVFVSPRSEPVGLTSPRWIAPLQRLLMSTPLGTGLYDTISCEYELSSYLQGCFYNPRHVTHEKVKRIHDHAVRRGSGHAYASLVTGFLDVDIFKSLPHVLAPVLLLWGRQARPTPVEHSVRLTSITRSCTLHVVENAGTWVHDEQSAQVNRVVAQFLNNEVPVASHAG